MNVPIGVGLGWCVVVALRVEHNNNNNKGRLNSVQNYSNRGEFVFRWGLNREFSILCEPIRNKQPQTDSKTLTYQPPLKEPPLVK